MLFSWFLYSFLIQGLVHAATYSIVFFDLNASNIDFDIIVNTVVTPVTSAVSGQYYTFNYNIGDSLEIMTTSFDNSDLGYYIIKNGSDESYKVIYDSREMSFYVVNECPSDQINCNFVIASQAGYLDGSSTNFYLNDLLVLSGYNTGSSTIPITPNDVIKVVVTGTPAEPAASMRYDIRRTSDNFQYSYAFWYYGNLLTSAVIETVGFTLPRDGAVLNAGSNAPICLNSTPLPAVYFVQLTCGILPTVTQTISSNSVGPQEFMIPAEYSNQQCLFSFVNTISGVNTVSIQTAMSSQDINEFLRRLGFTSGSIFDFYRSQYNSTRIL